MAPKHSISPVKMGLLFLMFGVSIPISDYIGVLIYGVMPLPKFIVFILGWGLLCYILGLGLGWGLNSEDTVDEG